MQVTVCAVTDIELRHHSIFWGDSASARADIKNRCGLTDEQIYRGFDIVEDTMEFPSGHVYVVTKSDSEVDCLCGVWDNLEAAEEYAARSGDLVRIFDELVQQ